VSTSLTYHEKEMKISRVGSNEPDFKPYDITITVETKKDQELLKGITMTNASIPRVVCDYRSDDELYKPIEKFLKSLQNSLRSSGCD